MGGGMNGAHVNPIDPSIGHIEDAPEAGIEAAEAWLRAQGCTRARGPMGPTTWHTYRAVIETSDRPFFLGEPTAQPTAWVNRGYAPIAHYASALADNQAQMAAAARHTAAMERAGWSLRTLEAHDGYESALECVHTISQSAFSAAFAFTPLPLSDFIALYTPLEPLVDPRLVFTAFDPSGRPGGFCFAVPDRLNPAGQTFIVKTLAVLPEHRSAGLGSWMTAAAHQAAPDLGYVGGGIHALMWTGSHSNQISKHAGHVFRRYALFEKPL